jgi:hypothetical protein
MNNKIPTRIHVIRRPLLHVLYKWLTLWIPVSELFQQIGKLQMELEWLKKKSQLL